MSDRKIQVWLRPDQCNSLLLLLERTADFVDSKIVELASVQMKACAQIGVRQLRSVKSTIDAAVKAHGKSARAAGGSK